jgi:hypothetical protein
MYRLHRRAQHLARLIATSRKKGEAAKNWTGHCQMWDTGVMGPSMWYNVAESDGRGLLVVTISRELWDERERERVIHYTTEEEGAEQ